MNLIGVANETDAFNGNSLKGVFEELSMSGSLIACFICV